MYNNDFNYADEGAVERRPSNLDRDAKLIYQSHVISKKRMKDKIESLNSGVYQGGLQNSNNRNKFLNGNQLLPSPKFDFFETSESRFVSQSNVDFTHRYEVEEIDPNKSKNKKNTVSKNPYENEGYQRDEGAMNRSNSRLAAKSQERVAVVATDNKKGAKKRDEEGEDVEDLEIYQNPKEKKGKNRFMSNSEILGTTNYEDANGVIAPVDLNEGNMSRVEQQNVEIDYSIFDLLNRKDSIDFITKPAPIGLVIKCQVYRHKGLYPEYKMCLQREDASLILLLSAKKKKRTKTPCYVINAMTFSNNETNTREVPFAKLKSNLLGTQFTLYDNGMKPKSGGSTAVNAAHDNDDDENTALGLRREFVSVMYGLNVLGFKGPRQMKVLVPGMDENYMRKEIRPVNEAESIIHTWKKVETIIESATKNQLGGSKMNIGNEGTSTAETVIQMNTDNSAELQQSANIIRLTNKSPVWNQTLRSFALNFNGRVTQASVKNFQIIHPVDIDYVVMQFGKVSKDVYTCDFSYPMCALQAFGVALSSLDNKLACD